MAGVQLPPAPGQAPPTLACLLAISGFTKHLPLKLQHRIAAQYSQAWPTTGAEAAGHCLGLGLGQQLHQAKGITTGDLVLINATHLHLVGNRRLGQQPAAGRGGGSEQKMGHG